YKTDVETSVITALSPHALQGETNAKLSIFSPMPNKIGSKTWSLMLKTLKPIGLSRKYELEAVLIESIAVGISCG
ncbi:MAG: hypothetical protein K2K65_07025, partial [Duncaniella sp.]|nr:hypothetical protein [Duncaniella sp.]